MNTFAERVRAERIRAGLSQGQLAKLAGLSQTTISDIERGRNEGSRDLVTLAKALKVSAEWLVTGLGEKQIDSGTRSPHVAVERFDMKVMSPKEIRFQNLQRLINLRFAGNAGKCADLLDIKRSQLSRWVTDNAEVRQGISEESARAMEAKLGLPLGSLDIYEGAQQTALAVTEIRRARLMEWFANRTFPEKEKSYLSQLINNKASFGETAARRLEKDYGMPDGYLDKPTESAQTPDTGATEHAELLEAWGYLLTAEKQAIMEQIRPMAAHNKAVLEQLQKR